MRPWGVDEVSQPVAMGDANQVDVSAWIESSSTSLMTTNVVVTVQTSSDLDNWTDTSFTITFTKAPDSGSVASSSSSQIAAPYVRLRYQGGGDEVMLGASIRRFKT